MTRRALPTCLTACMWVLAMLAGGCVPQAEVIPTTSAYESDRGTQQAEALQAILLPDLSRLAESVQNQVRERHSSLRGSSRPAVRRPSSSATRMENWA